MSRAETCVMFTPGTRAQQLREVLRRRVLDRVARDHAHRRGRVDQLFFRSRRADDDRLLGTSAGSSGFWVGRLRSRVAARQAVDAGRLRLRRHRRGPRYGRPPAPAQERDDRLSSCAPLSSASALLHCCRRSGDSWSRQGSWTGRLAPTRADRRCGIPQARWAVNTNAGSRQSRAHPAPRLDSAYTGSGCPPTSAHPRSRLRSRPWCHLTSGRPGPTSGCSISGSTSSASRSRAARSKRGSPSCSASSTRAD